MMHISVITRHAISNYGSFLQTYATQYVLEEAGHRVEIIDYIRRDESPWNIERTLLSLKPRWNSNPLLRAAYLMLRNPEAVRAAKAFEAQRRELLNLTRRYDSLEALRKDPPKADAYLTGSDQVWGPVAANEYDDAYVLSFAPRGARRLAYASSFGKGVMPDSVQRRFAYELGKFERITVREDTAVELLHRWGIAAEQVLDPTLLLSADEWRAFSEPIRPQRYVLVYEIHNDPSLDRYAKIAARKMGLPLVRISSVFHQCTRGGLFHWLPTCGQFISYIDQAECLITDSFHGTAFALNLNTPFIEVLPSNGTAGRNASILRLTGLTDRVVHGDEDVSPLEQEIDFAKVNSILGHERVRSKKVLLDMVEGSLE